MVIIQNECQIFALKGIIAFYSGTVKSPLNQESVGAVSILPWGCLESQEALVGPSMNCTRSYAFRKTMALRLGKPYYLLLFKTYNYLVHALLHDIFYNTNNYLKVK